MTDIPNYLSHVTCLECNNTMPYEPDLDFCEACNSPWLDAQYSYEQVAQKWQKGLNRRQNSLWRYRDLLPPVPLEFTVSMGEGVTPLYRAKKLEKALNHNGIYIKDERQTPTNSFKDRQGSLAISVLSQRGVSECVLASTGNAAVAYAAYTAQADIKLWVFLTSMVPAEKMREVALYGAEVIKVSGTYDEAKKVAADFAKRRKLHLDKGAKAIAGKESMKSLAFEIAEQLPLASGKTEAIWEAPDWFIQAVSGGIGPLGVLKGFQELYKMGLINRIPKIGVVQTEGCAPMVQAMAQNLQTAPPVVPQSRIVVLSTGAPGLAYVILREAQLENGGAMISVNDEDAFAAMRWLARTQGISVEPATSVAFAGLRKLIEQGTILPHESVVVNCSGHTFPVEKYIMDDQMVLDMKLSQQAKSHKVGLENALEHLEEQITTVLLIDDNPLDRLLVKRVLQDNKPYRVFEASGGPEAFEILESRRPDLIILDLNMPEMDGFEVLDRLKKNPATAPIPVIVVSAKELAPDEKLLLEGKIASLWQKGSFSAKALMEHMVKTIQTLEQPESSEIVHALENINQSTHKIVIIDDDLNAINMLRRILQNRGNFDIYEAHNGEEGLAVVKAQNPDLIILDLNMPDMNGFEVMEIVKADPHFSSIPIIIVSGKELSTHQWQQLDADAVSVLQKGEITVEKLGSQIDKTLS